MAGVSISVATADLGRGLNATIPLVAAVGATGVAFNLRTELPESEFGDTAIRQLLHRLSENGLRAATAYFPLRLPLYEAAHADERIASIATAMRRARQLRAGGLALPVGQLPASGSEEEVRLVETINAIAAAGNQAGTIPCLDFGRQPALRVEQVLAQINSGPVMLDLNPVNWLSASTTDAAAAKLRLGDLSFGVSEAKDEENQSLEDFIRTLALHIGHVQARDGYWAARGAHVETAVGVGQVDWTLLAALLDEAAYTGWLTVRRESGDAAEDIGQGVKFLRSLATR